MRLGLGVLRLSSKDFWRLTPRELKAAAEAVHGTGAPAPGRAELAALLRLFPDG